MVTMPGSRPDARRAALWPVGARCAAVLAAGAALGQCSAVPMDSAAAPAVPQNYGALVANTVKGFKPFATYSDFAISPPRWVHADTGWNWLVCLRYADRGKRRYYALFIEGGKVVNSRYDVLTDRCGAQQYAPFDLATGAIRSPAAVPQPIY